MNRRSFLKTNLFGAAALACGGIAEGAERVSVQKSASDVKTGGSRLIPIDGGKFHVWTKKIGKGKIQMLTLHGGPGFTHEYFECFEDFLPQRGIEYYYYDQLGSHYSDQPTDASLWTIPRFVEEVEQVRAALGLEKFYLYGHSWGSMLGIEYALKYGQHLKGLILASMTASMAAYNKYAAKLRAELPRSVVAILDKYEPNNDFENPEYQQTMMEKVYAKHVCRINPWPEPVRRAFRHLNGEIYNYMQGPNEFVITGTIKDWDRWSDLPRIRVPTLVIGGRYDEMNPADLKREADLIPNARLAICESGSHLSMYDDQENYFRHVIRFIRDAETARWVKP